MMATIQERDIFAQEVLLAVGANAHQIPERQVTGFLSMQGDCYNRELMVVGRAVNGWTTGIAPQKMTEVSVYDYAATVFDSVTSSGSCPMSWVSDCWGSSGNYNTRLSAFWRVIRAVVGALSIAGINGNTWSSHLVWSNLYKVSPAESGNPSTRLCKVQFPGCCALLNSELAVYRPKRLLLLTGLNWAEPFLQQICSSYTQVSDGYVEAVGQVGFGSGIQTQVVVAVHPQGKQEGKWVEEVIDCF